MPPRFRPRLPRRLLCLALLSGSLAAQAPLLQDEAERLRREFIRWGEGDTEPAVDTRKPYSTVTREVAAVAIVPGGSARTPLLDGGGLGTVLRGTGFACQFAWSNDHWDSEATILALHGTGEQTDHLRISTGRLAYRSQGGWRFAFERMPFQWGYGITGGYLFGTSAQAIPRVVMQTPMVDVSLFSVPLGRWGFETFLGKLGGDQQVPDWAADREQLLNWERTRGGVIQKSFQGGYRLKATFGSTVDMNFAISSLWGGIAPDGQDLTKGYGFKTYLGAFFGAQNIAVTEAAGDPAHPSGRRTRGQSNGITNIELRFRPSFLARWAGAKGAFAYISRGAENVDWQWKDFLRHPLSSIWNDVKADATTPPRTVWARDRREASPNLQWPNEAVGLQFNWEHADLGLEYLDNRTGERPGTGYQTYSHWFFLAGHSNGGDSMGDAFGGNIISKTISYGWQQDQWSGRVTITDGMRAFKDDILLWRAAHPGQDPITGGFQHLEFQGALSFGHGWRAGASFAVQQEQNLHFEHGVKVHGTNAIVAISRRF